MNKNNEYSTKESILNNITELIFSTNNTIEIDTLLTIYEEIEKMKNQCITICTICKLINTQ